LGGDDIHAFFRRFVDGTEDPPLESLLDALGIDWNVRPSSGPNDRGGKPASGAAPQSSLGAKIGHDLKLLHVYSAGAAERAGLAPNDVLVALDGLRASSDALDALVRRRSPGERVGVLAFRRDELVSVDVDLMAAPNDTCYLGLRVDAPERAIALRNAWLAPA
jgi:predicted metalloprotease with PDZ domain